MVVTQRNRDRLYTVFTYTVFIGVGISYSTLYAFHVVFSILILFLLSSYILNKKLAHSAFISKYDFIMIMIFVWYVFSFFWVSDIAIWMRYCIYLFFSISCFFLAKKTSDTIGVDAVLIIIQTIFFIQIAIGLLEALTSFRWPISPFSDYITYFGRHDAFEGSGQEKIAHLKSMPTAFQWNSNNFAYYLLITFPFVFNSLDKIKKIFVLFTFLFVVFATGSRTVIFLALIYTIYKPLIKIKGAFSLLLFAAIILIMLDILMWGWLLYFYNLVFEFFNQIVNADMSKLTSIGIRFNLYREAIHQFLSSYGLGLGAGGLVNKFEMFGGFGAQGVISPHNFWLELAVDGGLFSIALFSFWYILNFSKLKYSNFDSQVIVSSKEFMVLALPGALAPSSIVYFLPFWFLLGFTAYIRSHRRV